MQKDGTPQLRLSSYTMLVLSHWYDSNILFVVITKRRNLSYRKQQQLMISTYESSYCITGPQCRTVIALFQNKDNLTRYKCIGISIIKITCWDRIIFHYKDEKVVRPYHLYNRNSYISKTSSIFILKRTRSYVASWTNNVEIWRFLCCELELYVEQIAYWPYNYEISLLGKHAL